MIPLTQDKARRWKETGKRKKIVALVRERTRDSIDGRHPIVVGARFGWKWMIKRK